MPSFNTDVFTRKPSLPVFTGIRARTLNGLLRAVARITGNGEWVAADLSLGAWQSHQVAREFQAQLGDDPHSAPVLRRAAPPEEGQAGTDSLFAEVIGGWIDAEGSGDGNTQTALEQATRIVGKVRAGPARAFLVLVPRFGLSWEQENVLFLQFLAHGLEGTASQLLLLDAGTDPAVLPAGWEVSWSEEPEPPVEEHPISGRLLALVPGVIDGELAATLSSCDAEPAVHLMELPGGRLLIAPERRQPPDRVGRLAYDRLAVAAESVGWLKAYAQLFGNNMHVDADFLSAEAAGRLAEGGHGIALKLIARAIPCAGSPVKRALLQMYQQGWCVAVQRYRQASEVPDPSPAVPESLRGGILWLKGWGLVMAGDYERAIPYLERGQQLLETPYRRDRVFLYVLNIGALGKFRQGDVAGALQVELQIEEELKREMEATGRMDWPLRYVNSINLARVKRRQKEWDAAAAYYRRAFATTLGARSESDLVYASTCWAQLNETRGVLSPSIRDHRGCLYEAFFDWLRAALHWVSCSVPEALGWRVVAALLGRRPAPDENFCEAVSLALATALLRVVKRVHVPAGQPDLSSLDCDTGGAPAFVRTAALPVEALQTASVTAVGAPGWGVLVLEESVGLAFDGEQHRRLRRLLLVLLKWLGGAETLGSVAAIGVDDRLGREIPRDARELLDTCLRLRVPRIVYAGSAVSLDQELYPQLERDAVVSLGNAVDRCELVPTGVAVTFKRYLAPQIVSGEAGRILAALGDPLPLKVLMERIAGQQVGCSILETLRSLEQERFVHVDLDEQAPAVAGLQAASPP